MISRTSMQELEAHGVSVWLDDLSRGRLLSGDLARMIEHVGIVGVTTNPSIFATALRSDPSYQAALAQLAQSGASPGAAAESLMCEDVAAACDIFRNIFERSNGRDGRVSIEVPPAHAHDTDATIVAGMRLWNAIQRPNVMIKIPATLAGLEAITDLISKGISVNVTLIFSLERYRAVVNAYLTGLELARERGIDVSTVHSVASFFISRMDSEVDPQLRQMGHDGATTLVGRCAIANARVAYKIYTDLFSTERASYLLRQGANTQRLLWASTGVKDPEFPDSMYVTELVGENTVNTMPEATLNSFLEHGEISGNTILDRYSEAHAVLDSMQQLGIAYDKVVEQLEREGLNKFVDAYQDLLESVSQGLKK